MKEPSNWNEITLGQYREILAAEKRNLSAFGKAVLIVGIACSASPSVVRSMPKEDFVALLNRLEWIWKTQPKGEPADRFEIKGQLYLVPDDIGRKSIGEYADMDNYIHIHQEDPVYAMAHVLAVYCRRSGEPVIDDAKMMHERVQLFLGLPSTVADGLNGFFLTSEQLSNLNSRFFTIRRVELLTQTGIWLNSARHGAGLQRFMHWPKTTFLRWMRSRAALVGRH